MSEHFCTYFDHRYLTRGLALWRSLSAVSPEATLHVLCLTPETRAALERLSLPRVRLVSLMAVEGTFEGLSEAISSRPRPASWFTLTPFLPLYLLTSAEEITRVTYLDADLFFFADPAPVFEEAGDASVSVIEHRFPEGFEHLLRFGRFNVGWLTFTRQPEALDCLRHWGSQCLAACDLQADGVRFADQKYLDEWPARVRGLHQVRHRGANVAPWNLRRLGLEEAADGLLMAGGDRLLFFHFHGLEPARPGRPRRCHLVRYGSSETPLLRRRVYDPYEWALHEAASLLEPPASEDEDDRRR